MKIRKADWVIGREAEQSGHMVSMNGIVERIRTDLNNELSTYFRSQMSGYNGVYGEYEAEDKLYSINSYLEENNIDKYQLDFPLSSGSDIHLIPITENLHLRVLVVDEYYGGGDYEKYIDASFFMINDNSTKEDVDALIKFINKYRL